jgi:ABC-type arginine/histidine transport system permease subunit
MKQEFQNLFTTAFATFPVQDRLGQTIVQFGMNKLEYTSSLIAGAIYTTSQGNVLPEAIALESVELAEHILLQCNHRFNELNTTETKIIK